MSAAKGEIANVIRDLDGQIHGTVLRSEDAAFEAARRVWNAAIDRRPAAIVVCADENDVALALRSAVEHGFPVTVRGGGHNVAGRALADGSLLLDLSGMRRVTVDARSQIAVVQGGALWHDVDVATAEHALATTGGLISTTGVGGFTLGGGSGWLMRRHGLAIDNLVGATVALADGRSVRASLDNHASLFYGLRGGAGGFGVVTSFEFKVYPLREVLAGVVIRPAAEAQATLRAFRDFALQAPDDYCGMLVLAAAPPLPFLDAAWHGRPVVIHAMCWSGDAAAGQRALEPLRRSGTVLTDHVGQMPYLQWQHVLDPMAPRGRHQYWKTASYAGLSEATIEVLAQAVNNLPTRLTEIHVQHLGGAVARIPEADTAFSARSVQFFINVLGTTESSDEFATLRTKVRDLYDQLTRESLSSLLPNFSNQDDGDVTARFNAPQRARVQSIRQQYDPTGAFAKFSR
jgi:FAD/FMN-containing dehydrogenase